MHDLDAVLRAALLVPLGDTDSITLLPVSTLHGLAAGLTENAAVSQPGETSWPRRSAGFGPNP
jgi:hypothetical protein